MIAAAFGTFVCPIRLVFTPSGVDTSNCLVGGRFISETNLILTHLAVTGAGRE